MIELMDGIRRFEDLLIWQKGREFSKEIHTLFKYKRSRIKEL